MKRTLLLGVLAVMVAPGCGRIAGEGIAVGTGAKGVVSELLPPGSLAGYTRFELGTFQDGMGGLAPKGLWTYLPGKFREHAADEKLPDAPGKVCVVRGTILHYEGQGMGGLLLGDVEEVLARVELVDQATGQVLGQANCIGRSTTASRKGVKNKADGLAKAIVDWIKKHR